jgi:hypothetical protein
MDKPNHHLSDLFAQLGLPHDAPAIARFVAHHGPLALDVRLPDAPFWSATQAAFLRESLEDDSDWAGAVDQLAKALQSPPSSP